MDLLRFQKELRDILGVLLHGPVGALAATWNQVVAEAVDSIKPVHPLLVYWS